MCLTSSIVLIVAVATMFGAWEGGLTGIATENKELKKFHHDIESGKYLILVYARKEQGAAVRSMMREKHRTRSSSRSTRISSIRSSRCGDGTAPAAATNEHCKRTRGMSSSLSRMRCCRTTAGVAALTSDRQAA